jgi:hypothetical protein
MRPVARRRLNSIGVGNLDITRMPLPGYVSSRPATWASEPLANRRRQPPKRLLHAERLPVSRPSMRLSSSRPTLALSADATDRGVLRRRHFTHARSLRMARNEGCSTYVDLRRYGKQKIIHVRLPSGARSEIRATNSHLRHRRSVWGTHDLPRRLIREDGCRTERIHQNLYDLDAEARQYATVYGTATTGVLNCCRGTQDNGANETRP